MHTIMLVDDDPTMLRLLTTLLEIEGYKAAGWSGAIDVIAEIESIEPNIILMDVNLRGLNGIDILKKLRSTPAFDSTPVVMTSGMDYSAECLAAGANDFFVKPYIPDSLLKAIRSHLPQEA